MASSVRVLLNRLVREASMDGLSGRRVRTMTALVRGYPYAFHIALDGNGMNGLEGMAGVCLFLFDPNGNRHAYKIVYFDGIAAGHAVSVNPRATVGYLGN